MKKPMSSLGNKVSLENRAEADHVYRPKPFLTILDGEARPKKSKRNLNKPGKPNPIFSFTKVRKGARSLWTREYENLEALVDKVRRLPKPEPKVQAPSDPQETTLLTPKNFMTRRWGISAIAIALSLAAGSGVLLAGARFPLSATSLILPDEDSAQQALISLFEPEEGSEGSKGTAKLAPLPFSVSIQTYTIRSGDTLEKIAKRFGLRQDTIISINNLRSQSSIRQGVQLRIPNMDGIHHRVRSGESLSSISRTYGVDMTAVVDANDLASATISSGQTLFIPKARLASATLREFYGERFIWPAKGRISSPYGYRIQPFTGLRSFHSAIDIVLPVGTRVKATSEGKVGDTGYNSVFGNYVILKHANGYQSLYAHLSSISVKEGSFVDQSATVGLSGNSGQSTGPHLHFSIFKNGQALDPAKYVK
jgi:murein DD-endopeptidase MepM/ murein hydrolase activator NlpD